MALDKSKLKFFTSQHPRSGVELADKIATAYDNYARDARAGIAIPAILPAQKQLLYTTLIPALSITNPSSSVFLNALASGLTAYWMAPPVAFAQVSPLYAGFPVPNPAAFAPMVPTLQAALSLQSYDTRIQDALFRDTVDAYTRLITVLLTGIPPLPPLTLPLT